MVQHEGPVTASGVTPGSGRNAEAEWEGFVRRMRRMVTLGQFKRVVREAVMEPRLLFAMREMAQWCQPVQQARTMREAREHADRVAALVHFRTHRRDYIDPVTRVQMSGVRVGAEHRTEYRVGRNTPNARAWARRIAEHPEQVLDRYAAHTPYPMWAVLRPGYGPVRNPDEFWEQRINRDVRAARRRHTGRRIHPVGMTSAPGARDRGRSAGRERRPVPETRAPPRDVLTGWTPAGRVQSTADPPGSDRRPPGPPVRTFPPHLAA